MKNADIFEKYMTSEDSEKITDNIYWNKNCKKTYLFIKSGINIEEFNLELILDFLSNYETFDIDYFDLTIFSVFFDTSFISKLIESGFVILTGKCMFDTYNQKILDPDNININKENIATQELIIARLYKKYPVIFLYDLHIPKSVFRKLHKYELRVDTDFDIIVDKCSKIHGEGWLFENTRNLFKKLYRESSPYFRFTSFALYRDNELKAGEFGCVIGNMLYISYSGYYEESGAGTIQLTMMFQFLEESNFICCNLFGINDYKYKLGATDVYIKQYLSLFKAIKANSVKKRSLPCQPPDNRRY
jgi:leucyl/phenylalanyl-tRNA--protein transferase